MTELELFDANPAWRPLLAAYAAAVPAEDGWISRILEVEGIESDQLSAIHGKLIALGLLKFDLHAQTATLQYQTTPAGRQALLPPEQRQAIPEWMQIAEAA